MTASPKQCATGRINVTNYDAKPCDDAGAFTIAEVSITEEFAGDLVGVGSARLVLVTEAGGGTAHFAGMERFLGKVSEREGSFIFENSGRLSDGALESTWRVIAGSGTDQLAGLRGKGGCDPSGYSFEYWFE